MAFDNGQKIRISVGSKSHIVVTCTVRVNVFEKIAMLDDFVASVAPSTYAMDF